MKRNFRKPLVIAGPKTLLRHPKCFSKFEDMAQIENFERVLHYTNKEAVVSCRTLLLCSGKYVYDIEALLKTNNITDVALLTVEELFPFPEEELRRVVESTPANAKVCWVQEENMNSGAYCFVEPHLSRILR